MRWKPTRRNSFGGGPTKILGHKNKVVVTPAGRETNLIDVIAGLIDPGAETFFDAFAGTQCVAHRVKRMGLGVVSNDVRKASFYCGRALVENPGWEPDDGDADDMARGPADDTVCDLLAPPLGTSNALALGTVVNNARKARSDGHEIAADCAFYGILHVIMQELYVYHLHQGDGGELLGNGHLVHRDLLKIWRKWFVAELPKLVFDNGKRNACHNEDAVELAPRVQARSAYFDTPYPTGSSNYPGDFALLEDLCEVYETGVPQSGERRQPLHRFESRSSYLASVTHLLLRASHIPQWIISINTSSGVSPQELERLVAATGRSCTLHSYPVSLPTNIPRIGDKDNCECLLDCRWTDRGSRETDEIRARLQAMSEGLIQGREEGPGRVAAAGGGEEVTPM
ncbi:DNA adenine methylase [Verrucomicrobiota bacterium]